MAIKYQACLCCNEVELKFDNYGSNTSSSWLGESGRHTTECAVKIGFSFWQYGYFDPRGWDCGFGCRCKAII